LSAVVALEALRPIVTLETLAALRSRTRSALEALCTTDALVALEALVTLRS
jgi:hypothetical protein